jgi:hypothetical protein
MNRLLAILVIIISLYMVAAIEGETDVSLTADK